MSIRPTVWVLLAAAAFFPALANARRPITLKVPKYEVGPLTDREVCTFVPVPGDAPFDLGGWVVDNKGVDGHVSTSHHFILYAYVGDDLDAMNAAYNGKVVDDNACIGIAPDPTKLRFLGGAQTPHYAQIMPKGLALRVASTGAIDGKKVIGFVLNSHWINASNSKRMARPSIKLIPAKPKTIKKMLQPIFEVVANAFLKVPPGETGTTGSQWGPGQPDIGAGFLGGIVNPKGPACVTMLTGHMHRRGALFEAIYSGDPAKAKYTSTKYDDPGQTNFNPPLLVSPGETIKYTCTQDNATDPRMGCEEVAGVTPGKSIVENFNSGGITDFIAPAKLCSTDADCAGFGTGRCVPANLVFGFRAEDDMCILPGYYYEADPVHGCDLTALQ